MHTNALRLSRLPVNLRHLVFLQFRCVVTSADDHNVDIPYPFPLHTNPTPYDIFHLPRGATQSQIKARYYELVRVYHPDCPAARRLPPNTSHSRFQAISNAYAILSGKRPDGMSSSPSHTRYSRDTQYYEEIARRKRAEWRGPAGSDEFGYGPGLWDKKEKETFEQSMLVVTIAFTLVAAILPVMWMSPFSRDKRHNAASKHLAAARREAKDIAEIRRVALVQSTDRGSTNMQRCKADPG